MPDHFIFLAIACPILGIVMMIHVESFKEKIRFHSPNKQETNRILNKLYLPHNLSNIRTQLLEVCPQEELIKSMVKWIRIYQATLAVLMISIFLIP